MPRITLHLKTMADFFGIDTSNYTTSAAIYSSDENIIYQSKKMLPVKHGELGLRQSDAVFHHTKQLPEVLRGLFGVCENKIEAIGVSSKPRNTEKSYMPCFLCGVAAANSASLVSNAPIYQTSHQIGHILAALYSADALTLIDNSFYAYHISGGTTDLLLCTPDDENILNIERIGGTSDLNAGQAVDRIGVAMGFDFPAGKQIEEYALRSDKKYNPKVSINGLCCSLSGVENKCEKMLCDGENKADVARFCLDIIAKSIINTALNAIEQNAYPFVFAGGVMSNSIIREQIENKIYDCCFAAPEFSCDNAAGCAIFAYLKHTRKNPI